MPSRAKYDSERAQSATMPPHLRRDVHRGRPQSHGLAGSVNTGGELTDEEVAYARFIDVRKRRLGVLFPAWSQVLAWTKEFLKEREATP